MSTHICIYLNTLLNCLAVDVQAKAFKLPC